VGGGGPTQVRQQKGTGAPYNIVTMKVQPLQEGQILVKPENLAKFGVGDPDTPAGDKSPFESVKYIVRRIPGVGGKPDAFEFTGSGGAAVQVRQERGREGQLGSPLNLVDGKAVTLQPGDEVVSFAGDLPDNLKGTAGSDGNNGNRRAKTIHCKTRFVA
jgi:hypothetical protein